MHSTSKRRSCWPRLLSKHLLTQLMRASWCQASRHGPQGNCTAAFTASEQCCAALTRSGICRNLQLQAHHPAQPGPSHNGYRCRSEHITQLCSNTSAVFRASSLSISWRAVLRSPCMTPDSNQVPLKEQMSTVQIYETGSDAAIQAGRQACSCWCPGCCHRGLSATTVTQPSGTAVQP